MGWGTAGLFGRCSWPFGRFARCPAGCCLMAHCLPFCRRDEVVLVVFALFSACFALFVVLFLMTGRCVGVASSCEFGIVCSPALCSDGLLLGSAGVVFVSLRLLTNCNKSQKVRPKSWRVALFLVNSCIYFMV